MPKKAKKERLDVLLVEKALACDIDEARRFILAGLAVVDDHRVDKAGTKVSVESDIRLKNRVPYVSRGGLKLEKAREFFEIDFNGKAVIDVGASTGGFSDVALINGAEKVFAVDIGRGQLDPKISNDSRVSKRDETNFRTITYDSIGQKVDMIIGDVSFISLKLILPSCVQFSDDTEAVFLIKPQFEAAPGEVMKGGIVEDRNVHERVIIEVTESAEENGFGLCGLTVSPIKGAKGNVEYLAYFIYNAHTKVDEIKGVVHKVVHEEYSYNCKTSR